MPTIGEPFGPGQLLKVRVGSATPGEVEYRIAEAIVDTGATRSGISPELADEPKLDVKSARTMTTAEVEMETSVV